jgi:hypothetical protein
MFKLFVVAILLIAGGAIIGLTTDLNPALLIIAGFVCGLIAAVRGAPQPPDHDGAASPGAEADAHALSNYRFLSPTMVSARSRAARASAARDHSPEAQCARRGIDHDDGD